MSIPSKDASKDSKAIHDTLITCGQPEADAPGEIELIGDSLRALDGRVRNLEDADDCLKNIREIQRLLARANILLAGLIESLPRG
jgi:hypothetical protein